jgi:hypothetical protein
MVEAGRGAGTRAMRDAGARARAPRIAQAAGRPRMAAGRAAARAGSAGLFLMVAALGLSWALGQEGPGVGAFGAATVDRRPVDQQRLPAEVLRLRAVATTQPAAAAAALLGRMPRSDGAAEPETAGGREPLWSTFFRNVVVAGGHLASERPVVAYYNPLVDVFVLTVWQRRAGGGGLDLLTIRALPGAHLARPDQEVGSAPAWQGTTRPLDALRAVTWARLDRFARTYPAAARQRITPGSPDSPGWRASQTAAEARLLAHAAALSLADEPGLRAALERLNAALAGDAGRLLRAEEFVGNIDPVILAGLTATPGQVRAAFALDAVYRRPGDDRWVALFSLPDDGTAYLVAEYATTPDGYRLDGLGRFDLSLREE